MEIKYPDIEVVKDFKCGNCHGRFSIDSKRYELILYVINDNNKEIDDEIGDFCEDCGEEILIHTY